MQDPEPTRPPEQKAKGERVRPSKPKRRTDFPGAEHLVAESASEVLDRLIDEDPFEMGPRLVARLIDQAILVDPQRLIEMLLARVAHDAMEYEGEPGLDEWIDSCIDSAVASFLVREAEEDKEGLPPEFDDDPYYNLFAEILGVEPPMARTVSLHYHYLSPSARRTFQAIFVDQKSIHRWVAEGHGPPERVRAQLNYAIMMMSTLGQADIRDPELPPLGENEDD